MSRTIITHPDGSITTITRRSGCGGCFWALLGVFVVFAPGAWAANGTIPVAVAVLMYVVLAVVVIAAVAQRSGRRQAGPVPLAPVQAWPPPPRPSGPVTFAPLPPPLITPDGKCVSYDDGQTFRRADGPNPLPPGPVQIHNKPKR